MNSPNAANTNEHSHAARPDRSHTCGAMCTPVTAPTVNS